MTTYQCKHGVICGPDGRCERCAKESGAVLMAAFGVAPEIGGRSSTPFPAEEGGRDESEGLEQMAYRLRDEWSRPASVVSSEEGGCAAQITPPPKVTCRACQKETPYHDMYRCLQCRGWFHESCMALHLKESHNVGGDRIDALLSERDGVADVASAHGALLDLVLSRKYSGHSLQTAIRKLIAAAKNEAYADVATEQMRVLTYRLTGKSVSWQSIVDIPEDLRDATARALSPNALLATDEEFMATARKLAASVVGDASEGEAWPDAHLTELEGYYAKANIDPNGAPNPAMCEVLDAVPSLIASLRSTRAALEEARRERDALKQIVEAKHA